MNPQRRNAEQVDNDDRQVQRMDAHRLSFPWRTSEVAEKCVEDSGLPSPRQEVAGPANPYRVGVERASREIEKAAECCLQEARVGRNDVAAVGAGLAGTGNPELKEGMRASIAAAFPGAAVSVFTDLEAALAAAGEGPVIVLVAGTGSAAIGRNSRGQIWRTGGQGPRLGDDGSAFDIGSRAVARAMGEQERLGRNATLGSKILEELGYASWQELRERATSEPDNVFPLVFPVVASLADAGDAAARKILLQA